MYFFVEKILARILACGVNIEQLESPIPPPPLLLVTFDWRWSSHDDAYDDVRDTSVQCYVWVTRPDRPKGLQLEVGARIFGHRGGEGIAFSMQTG